MKAKTNKPKHSQVHKTRLTIGLLIGDLEEIYQTQVWPGVADVAYEQDVNLICFAGGSLDTPYKFDFQRNVIYNLVTPNTVDGLVLLPGSLGTFVSFDKVKDFCNRYRPLPMVSIASRFEDMPSILLNNKQGMRELVTHLVEDHGYQRIAFIRGPRDSKEAEDRYQAYVEVLAKHSLPLEPNLVVPGDFIFDTGVEAIRLLVDERKLDFEAIVAASDQMALGALEALQARGINVPNEVALAGFDDGPHAKSTIPPLTTVQQPLYEQGRRATETLLALLADEQVPEQIILSPELAVRRSCGCFSENVLLASPEKIVPGDTSLDHVWAKQRRETLAQIKQIGGPSITVFSEGLAQLLDAFYAELKGGAARLFLSTLDEVLYQVSMRDSPVSSWHKVLAVLHYRLLPYCSDKLSLERGENILQQGHSLIAQADRQVQMYYRLQAEQLVDTLSEVSQELITTFDLAALMDMLAWRLPRLNINSCYLALYESEQMPPEWSRLILAYIDKKRIELSRHGDRFRSYQLAPDGLLPQEKRYTMAVFPLFFQERQIGFVLFEIKQRMGRVYELLRAQISSALRGALLFQEHIQVEEELARSNQELEQFAYVASHDLQEPLRMVRSYMQLLEKRYKDKLDEDANEFITFAIDGATRMHLLINGLLLYSRVGTKGKRFELTNCAEVLQAVLANLALAIEANGVRITYDDLPTIMADDVQLIQLFQNLIGNAIKFRGDQSPKIHVGIKRGDSEWVFWVRDNGIGMDPQQTERIFMIFQRLHTNEEYEGTGIGLAVCKKIVERHAGRIWVESEPGKGSTFFFTIPDRDVASSTLC